MGLKGGKVMYRILDEVKAVLKQRALEDYGPGKAVLERVQMLWSEYFDFIFSTKDVAMMMALFKIARESFKPKRDNLIDAIGYLVLASELED